jgi:hypothetical protein
MALDTLAAWHRVVADRDRHALEELLSTDVVFHSPVLHAPQVGKPLTLMYLSAAMHVLANDTFRYVREVAQGNDAVLEFETDIEGIRINGIDMIRWNDDGQIVDFKVMVRPLKGFNLLHQKMAEMLRQGSA